MYDGHETGIRYFGQFWDELRSHDPASVVALQVKSYPVPYLTEFLLSMPLLLETMDTETWVRAFALAAPRTSRLPSHFHMEGQGDIYFLCKFLRLNAVELVVRCDSVSARDKAEILRTAKICADLLTLDAVDTEGMDGVEFMEQSQLEAISTRLAAEGAWLPLPNESLKIRETFAELGPD